MKKKLFVSAMSLVMAVILMTSTSFAWFTVSQKATADMGEVTMQAQENLEIALASEGPSTVVPEVKLGDVEVGQTTWGSIVDEFGDVTVNFPAISGGSTGIQTIHYAEDGRVETDYIPGVAGDWDGGVVKFTAEPVEDDERDIAVIFGVMLRSNVAGEYTADFSGINEKWKVTLCNESYADIEKVTLSANTPTFVGVKVYLNGEKVLAKDVAEDLTVSGIGFEFTLSAS